jgi:hypothetical protein
MRLLSSLVLAVSLYAQSGFFPLGEIRPGMQATGRTVFSGSRIEEFQAEILGVLENTGPKQSLILARLSGGPLASTGVLQGMSGSPVYIGGRLVGAIAMAFSFSKEPVAAIRPIEDLLRAGERAPESRLRARASLADTDLTRGFEPVEAIAAGGAKLVDIATPVSFGGFTRGAIEHFAPQLRTLGLEPRQGLTGSGRLKPGLGDPASLQPGSMISVQLLTGDMSVGAEGTVTHIDGRRVYAFGHQFLSIGGTDIPFARADVLALVPNLAASFKISAPREWMGTIREDRSTGVAGEVGRQARMTPLSISVTHFSGRGPEGARPAYQMEMVDDRYLSPILVQMALFSAIDASERTVGAATLAIRGEIQFQGSSAPIRVNNTYSGEYSLPEQASLGPAVTLAYALQSGFDELRLKNIRIDIDSYDELKQMRIEQVWTSRRQVSPGEAVDLTVVLVGPNGQERSRTVTYRVPTGALAGPLYFTVADGAATNFTEFRQTLTASPRTPSQLVAFLNSLRDNTKAYVRVWRAEADYDVQGQSFPAPPPSVAQILARTQTGLGAAVPSRNSKVAELVVGADGMVVSGSKTVQVEIKE